jgi:hypothetical protein
MLRTDTIKNISIFNKLSVLMEFLSRLVGKDVVCRRVLVFFPHNLSTPRTGAHKRAYHVISCLRGLGFDVLLFSSTIFTDFPWDRKSSDLLRRNLGINVYVHKGTKADARHLEIFNGSDDWAQFTPPDMLKAFKKVVAQYKPDLLLVNYAMWGGLRDVVPTSTRSIIEMHDLVTLNGSMQKTIWEQIGSTPIDPYKVPDELIETDYFLIGNHQVENYEFLTYDCFDDTVAIASKETKVVQSNTKHTKVTYIPLMLQVHDATSKCYGGLPVFIIGANIFNFQGYAFWVRKIQPYLIDQTIDFCLEVYGDGCNYLVEVPGVHLNGFMPDLTAVYQNAPFAVCPLLGGTGQQVKVIEAMAYGVPVVVMQHVAESSPVVHGENGFIASTATEFAEYCLQLYVNRALCRKMGDAARQKIASDYSFERMRDALAQIFV